MNIKIQGASGSTFSKMELLFSQLLKIYESVWKQIQFFQHALEMLPDWNMKDILNRRSMLDCFNLTETFLMSFGFEAVSLYISKIRCRIIF